MSRLLEIAIATALTYQTLITPAVAKGQPIAPPEQTFTDPEEPNVWILQQDKNTFITRIYWLENNNLKENPIEPEKPLLLVTDPVTLCLDRLPASIRAYLVYEDPSFNQHAVSVGEVRELSRGEEKSVMVVDTFIVSDLGESENCR